MSLTYSVDPAFGKSFAFEEQSPYLQMGIGAGQLAVLGFERVLNDGEVSFDTMVVPWTNLASDELLAARSLLRFVGSDGHVQLPKTAQELSASRL